MERDPPLTLWIIAGESSGDLYGARLAAALQALEPSVQLRGMGGEAMAAAGVDLMVDSSHLAVVGFVEVFRHAPEFFRVFYGLVRQAEQERPDAVILIDYPGFNVRLAKRLHRLGIRVVYYVSPQVWAWGKRRIPKLARTVDRMLVIFPFETSVYEGTGLDVKFVGHPLLEILQERRQSDNRRDPNTVLLLPGSRSNEVKTLFPVMIRTAARLRRRHPDLHFVAAAPSPAVAELLRAQLRTASATGDGNPDIEVREGETLDWMQRAAAGLAASGTVTVEAAILGLPLTVAYRLNPLTHLVARLLVRIPYFTMVNLVAGRKVFEEFLQKEVRAENLAPALEAILPGGARHDEVKAGIADALHALGEESTVGENTARAVLEAVRRPASNTGKVQS